MHACLVPAVGLAAFVFDLRGRPTRGLVKMTVQEVDSPAIPVAHRLATLDFLYSSVSRGPRNDEGRQESDALL